MVGTTFSSEETQFKKPIFSIYEGNFLANKRNGKGKMRWKDGSVFDGDWHNDMRIQGKLTLEDGGTYIGKFNNKDQYHGLGTIEYDKFKYTGVFINHEPPKYGWFEVKDLKDIYYGELENFKKNGLGKMEYENGDIYEG